MLRLIGIALLVLTVVFVGFSYYVSRPVFDGTRDGFRAVIADPADAWTFARTAQGLILVSRHVGDAVMGVNLSDAYGIEATSDLIAFVSDLDQTAIADTGAFEQRYPLEELLMPLSYAYPSVAAGTNFKEHAAEIYSDDPPFLFPKLVEASGWNQSVPFVPRLDYEAEVCVFPLEDVVSADAQPRFGLVLCNDFTDRWTLVKEIELGQPLGFTGFASGKGCEKCLPTGYLVVIPKSRDFFRSIDVSLYVNDELRQQFTMKEMILSISELVSQAFSNQEATYWKGKEPVSLLPLGYIPKGTLILTGTGAGVMFKPVNIWNQGFYLQAGDLVRTEASYLGHLENRVERH